VGAMELARSLSNEILGKLRKEFRPDFLLIEALPINNRFLKRNVEIFFSSSLDLQLKFTIPKFFLCSAKPVTNYFYT
jgi:hypothetical protein